MEKRWKWFTVLILILLWNGCGKEGTESEPNLLSPSTVPVTIQPMVEGDKTPTEPMEPTGVAEPTAPVNSPMPTLADAEPSLDGGLPDYNPAEILRQRGGVVIPWGDSISVDMDGDGKEETVSMRLTIDSERSGNDWWLALPVLTVDDAVFGEEDFHQLCYPQFDIGGGFNYLGWCILDVDTSDSYLEVAVGCWNPVQNPRTCFLRYEEGEFVWIGSIEGNIVNMMMDLPRHEESGWEIPWEPDWEAARLKIWNSEDYLYLKEIKGDGIIRTGGYHNVLETCEAVGKMTWRLENPEDLHAELVLDPPYLDFGEAPERNYIPGLKELRQDTVFYQNKGGEDGATVTLPAGTEVWFRRYYLEGRWIEMVYDEGGVYEEGAQSVWFQVVVEIEENRGEYPYGLIRLPDGEIVPRDCFGGNYIWGGG